MTLPARMKTVRLIFRVLWVSGEFSCVLEAGETASYFAHTDCYIFKHRSGYAPYYPAGVVNDNPGWFNWIESEDL